MFTLEDVRAEYNRLDEIFGVDTSKIPIKISKRARVQRGCCVYHGCSVKEIRLSDFIFDDPAEYFYEVIRHEYTHALVKIRYPYEKHVHDEVWKKACLEVGCSPNRFLDVPPEMKRRQVKKPKYIVTCLGCGTQWAFYRKTNLIKCLLKNPADAARAKCQKCGHKGVDFKVCADEEGDANG